MKNDEDRDLCCLEDSGYIPPRPSFRKVLFTVVKVSIIMATQVDL